jgi:hypothetical protein
MSGSYHDAVIPAYLAGALTSVWMLTSKVWWWMCGAGGWKLGRLSRRNGDFAARPAAGRLPSLRCFRGRTAWPGVLAQGDSDRLDFHFTAENDHARPLSLALALALNILLLHTVLLVRSAASAFFLPSLPSSPSPTLSCSLLSVEPRRCSQSPLPFTPLGTADLGPS